MNTKLKSRLMSIAHAVKSQFETFADALRHAWLVIRLFKLMKTQYVSFSFKKVDGSIREAIGTLRSEVLPESKNSGRPTNYWLFTFWSVPDNGYRSAKIENLIF